MQAWDPQIGLNAALELSEWTGGDPVLSVGGISTYLQALLETDPYLIKIWVVGEVSSRTVHRNGHLFLVLSDPQTGDQLKGVIWQSAVARLTVLPQAGQQVIALGQIRTYSRSSHYQIQIWEILPAGEGLLALRYQQLRARLAAEGCFDPDRKRPLPDHPQSIAVVSSPQAAAWGDIQRTLRSRYPGLLVLFSGAVVQGDRAPHSIVQAIRRVEQDGRAELLILARGGGASEDLACFNDERVVRAIVECRIPVITGIGHQRDETLADLAADVQAHTPTAAAEQVVPHLDQLDQDRGDYVRHLLEAVEGIWNDQQKELQRIREALEGTQLDRQIDSQQQELQGYWDHLKQATFERLDHLHIHQQTLAQYLAALDPRAVLRRGYALVRTEAGQHLRSAHVTPGDRLHIELATGTLWARVEEVDLADQSTRANTDHDQVSP